MRVYIVVEIWEHNGCDKSTIEGVYLKAMHAARSIAGLGVKEPEELINELVDSENAEQVDENGRTTAYIEMWEAD